MQLWLTFIMTFRNALYWNGHLMIGIWFIPFSSFIYFFRNACMRVKCMQRTKPSTQTSYNWLKSRSLLIPIIIFFVLFTLWYCTTIPKRHYWNCTMLCIGCLACITFNNDFMQKIKQGEKITFRTFDYNERHTYHWPNARFKFVLIFFLCLCFLISAIKDRAICGK